MTTRSTTPKKQDAPALTEAHNRTVNNRHNNHQDYTTLGSTQQGMGKQ